MSGSALRRAAKLAGVPLGAGARSLRPSGRQDNIVRTAEQLAGVLGELKGGAMKVGQALSIFAPVLPDELAAPLSSTLTSLQAEAPPMPARTVHRVLERQLGAAWRERFAEFDDEPAAAASIGQVHRARWASDGAEVAVKVQYPEAEKAIRSDLRQLRVVTPVLQRMAPGVDMGELIAAIRDNVVDELDYRLEADHQRAFHAAFGDGREPLLHVPRVYASAPKAMVSEWVDGRRLSEVIGGGTLEERSRASEALTVFEFSSPSLVRRMHTDPHPGNFLLRPDGRMSVIDFGACVRLPDGLPRPLVELVAAVVDGRRDDLMELALRHGYVSPGRARDVTPEMVEAFLLPFSQPLSQDDFVFTVEWLREVLQPFLDPTSEQSRLSRRFGMPRQYVMIHRVLAGAVAVLAQLEAPAPYRQVIAEHYPEMLGGRPA
ncbi:ABC1 kinase family protein [Corynebacterium sp. 335C]